MTDIDSVTPQKVHMVFDTETTGIHRESQVIALAWMIMRNDSCGTEVERYHSLWRLSAEHKWSPEAEKVHGISGERLNAEGQDPRGELSTFFRKVDEVQRSGGYIVAHNLKFDEARINATAIANNFEPLWPEALRRLCTLVTIRSVVWSCFKVSAAVRRMVEKDCATYVTGSWTTSGRPPKPKAGERPQRSTRTCLSTMKCGTSPTKRETI